MEIIVVGSGPVGTFSALKLLENGHKVLMLDIGDKVSKVSNNFKAELTVPQLQISSVEKLWFSRLNTLKQWKKSDVMSKLFFRDVIAKKSSNTYHSKCISYSSTHQGGLGNIWGGNISAIAYNDATRWPFKIEELNTHFHYIENNFPVSAEENDLTKRFPYCFSGSYDFSLSGNSKNILDKYEKHKIQMNENGIFLGRAPVAVRHHTEVAIDKCTQCGLCMHGCPIDLIFNPNFHIFPKLRTFKNFKYRQGLLVESFIEKENKPKVIVKNIETGTIEELKAKKVFIAAGAIETSKIIINSKISPKNELILRDSDKYMFLFRCNKSEEITEINAGNKLAELALHLTKLKSTTRTVHIQLYSMNDHVLEFLFKIFGYRLTKKFQGLIELLLKKYLIGMIYINSEDSDVIRIKKQKTKFLLRGHSCGESKKIVAETIKLIRDYSYEIGGKIIKLSVIRLRPGSSIHYGATMPMSMSPSTYNTDILGRPLRHKNVHIVDASILPTIPGTPTTWLTIANAIRIVSHV